MDFSSVLPLIMNSGGGDGNNRLASVLSSMNGTNSAPTDTTALLSSLMNRNGADGGTANIMNLLTLANKNKERSSRPSGFKPIKEIVPNDILGILAKRMNS